METVPFSFGRSPRTPISNSQSPVVDLKSKKKGLKGKPNAQNLSKNPIQKSRFSNSELTISAMLIYSDMCHI